MDIGSGSTIVGFVNPVHAWINLGPVLCFSSTVQKQAIQVIMKFQIDLIDVWLCVGVGL